MVSMEYTNYFHPQGSSPDQTPTDQTLIQSSQNSQPSCDGPKLRRERKFRLIPSLLWRFVAFASSIVGLLCYALSSSFTRLFGQWNLIKILVYSVVSFIICSFVVFPKKWKQSRSLMVKAHAGFLVLVVTSAYSFFYDKAVNGSKPDVLTLISCVAFAFMALSLSRQTDVGFEVDLLNYFLGCFILQLMKINLMLIFPGVAFSYSLIVLRSSLDSQIQIGNVTTTDYLALDVGSANQTDDDNRHHQSHSDTNEPNSLEGRPVGDQRHVALSLSMEDS